MVVWLLVGGYGGLVAHGAGVVLGWSGLVGS